MDTVDKPFKNSFFSFDLIGARLKRVDYLVVYISIFILAVLLLTVVFVGEGTPFYNSIKQPNKNPWFVRGLWVVGSILSYVTFYFIADDPRTNMGPKDLILSVLFLISGFMFLAWGVVYYYAENISLSMWISLIILIYNYFVFIYVWDISPVGAIFLIPNLILYVYLVYISVQTISLNNIPI